MTKAHTFYNSINRKQESLSYESLAENYGLGLIRKF